MWEEEILRSSTFLPSCLTLGVGQEQVELRGPHGIHRGVSSLKTWFQQLTRLCMCTCVCAHTQLKQTFYCLWSWKLSPGPCAWSTSELDPYPVRLLWQKLSGSVLYFLFYKLQNLDYIGSEGNFSIVDEVAIDIRGNDLKLMYISFMDKIQKWKQN